MPFRPASFFCSTIILAAFFAMVGLNLSDYDIISTAAYIATSVSVWVGSLIFCFLMIGASIKSYTEKYHYGSPTLGFAGGAVFAVVSCVFVFVFEFLTDIDGWYLLSSVTVSLGFLVMLCITYGLMIYAFDASQKDRD